MELKEVLKFIIILLLAFQLLVFGWKLIAIKELVLMKIFTIIIYLFIF